MFLQFLANGLVLGAVYGLVALGFALIYNTTHIFHIAYAALFMICPYMLMTINKILGVSFFIAFLCSIVITVLLSVCIEIFIYRPLERKKSSPTVLLISSIGVMIVLVNTIALFYGDTTQVLRKGGSSSISLGDMILTSAQLLQFSISLILMVVFFLILKYSRFGIQARALRDDPELCAVLGLDIQKIRLVLFIISAIFAGTGGALIGYDVGMYPHIGMPMLLNAVAALIIGGIGRFEAPIYGGGIIGILQSLIVLQFSVRWQDAVTFILLIFFLIFRPQGILGDKERLF